MAVNFQVFQGRWCAKSNVLHSSSDPLNHDGGLPVALEFELHIFNGAFSLAP